MHGILIGVRQMRHSELPLWLRNDHDRRLSHGICNLGLRRKINKVLYSRFTKLHSALESSGQTTCEEVTVARSLRTETRHDYVSRQDRVAEQDQRSFRDRVQRRASR
jgi:hypothetical protein